MRLSIDDNKIFAYRVAGIARHGNKILLHKSVLGHNNWALPGGACAFGQSSTDTLIRELNEELGAAVEIGSLQFIVENFFDWEGKRAHELGLYYEFSFIDNSTKFYEQPDFTGLEEFDEIYGKHALLFKWIELEDLYSYNLKPSFLKKLLFEKNLYPKHIIHYDKDLEDT